jgi:PAS domain S-box-containing protein
VKGSAGVAQLAALLDGSREALLLFDALSARLLTCNKAAMRLLGCEPGQGIAEVAAGLPTASAAWLQQAWHASNFPQDSERLPGYGGRQLCMSLWREAAGLCLRLHEVDQPGPARLQGPNLMDASAQGLLEQLWVSAQPMTLQDESFAFVDVNQAYLDYTGFTRGHLIGLDPVSMQPLEDQATHLASRERLNAMLHEGLPAPLAERRFTDASGRERWFRAAFVPLFDAQGQRLTLSVLNDATSEHVARAQAERSLLELAQWFDLSSIGMLVFDRSGLIIRSNRAFEQLVGSVPVSLADADEWLRELLGWVEDGGGAGIHTGAAPRWTQTPWPLPDGRTLRLAARVSAFAIEGGGPLRYMAIVEDRSTEEQRDLALLERGALMNSASIGVATFDPQRGWLQAPPVWADAAAEMAGDAAPASKGAGLLAVNRERVMPQSRPEYERLQTALRALQRAEARYAVHLPGHGLRWLHTRVEPQRLPSGAPAVSVVTLDVTEQEQARHRNEQLLRELTTILDSSDAGIAYLRGPMLVRCNHRFERILGLAPGAAAGMPLERLFAGQSAAEAVVRSSQLGLSAGRSQQAELVLPGNRLDDDPRWYALSLTRAQSDGEEAEAVVVLSDITRLKAQQREMQGLLRAREAMFELSEVGIVHWSGGQVERANAAMAALTGYDPQSLQGLPMAQLHESRSAAAAFDAQVSAALAEGGSFTGERWLRQRDGRLRWVQVGVRPYLAGESGAGADVIASYVDLDERQRARQTLQQQAQRTRAVLDSVLVGIVTAREGRIEWMNRSARRMFAAELSVLQGEALAVLAPEEADHPLRREDWPQRLAQGVHESFECRLRGRDGREFWVVGNAVLSLGEGDAAQVTFALLDIERRRQAEARIAQAQASLQRILQTAPLAIALFDARSLRLLQLNQRALDYFGQDCVEPSALVGQVPQEFLDQSSAQELQAMLAQAGAAQDAQWRGEHSQLLPDGLRRIWDVRVVGTGAAEGQSLPQWLLVASDVTLQRAEDQARFDAAVAQRERLVKEVHHRIKNNLQGVAGLLQNSVTRRPELAQPLQEAIGQVNAIAQVYGLQVGAQGPLQLAALLHSVAGSVQRAGSGGKFWLEFGDGPARPSEGLWDEAGLASAVTDLRLPEAEAIPVALALNELLVNAQRHGSGAIVCSLRRMEAHAPEVVAEISVRHPGQLPPGFELDRLRPGVHGLPLVRALLPRRGSALTLRQNGAEVVARLELRSPALRLADSVAAAGAVA